MELAMVNAKEYNRDMLQEFGGINQNLRIQDNQFADMKNMTADHYPLLSPRKRRGIVTTLENPNGLFAKNRLMWVDGTSLYYNGDYVAEVQDNEKRFVSMGAYVLIFPDKTCYNTDNGEYKSMGAKFQTVGPATFHLCKIDGEEYADYLVSASAPEEPKENQMWLDISQNPNVLKQFSGTTNSWVAIATTYVKIEATGIGAAFKQYDCVNISGCSNELFNTDMAIWACDTDYIVVTAVIDEVFTEENTLTIERKVPDMDYLTESENRVWGCSSKNHEIYACKQGDPTNWYCYMGLSTDSYAVTVGTDGNFTGACTHMGYVLFFKDHVVHKIYGSQPSNYQVTNVNCRGVQGGSENSLVIVNETLLFKSRNDICVYDGSLPTSISEVIKEDYTDACAGALNGKYYISMKNAKGIYEMFVYDTNKATWHKEDDTQARYFAYLDGDLYYIDGENRLMCVEASNGELEEPVKWYVETGDMGMSYPDNKYISKIQIRLEIAEESEVWVEREYDSSGIWEEVAYLESMSKKNITIPILLNRCDHMRLRINGVGDCKIYSLAKTTERGSEL